MLQIEPDRLPSKPRDAATVILLRDSLANDLEVFLVRRHGRSGFMGGVHVFPGGKLDDADRDPSLWPRVTGRISTELPDALGEPTLPVDMAAGLFAAALRETFEEAGVLLAERTTTEELEVARRALHDGASLSVVAARHGLVLRFDALHPQARWITPEVEPRRYDTRFFVARAPADQEARHDAKETTAGAWQRPRSALDAERDGTIHLAPPTMRTLEILTSFQTVDAVIASLSQIRPPCITPVFKDLDGTWALTLPGDPEHPDPQRALPGATRFILQDGRWRPAHTPETASGPERKHP